MSVCLAQSACSLIPPYQRPQALIAADWNRRPEASVQAIPVTQSWWRTFRSPELDRLIAQAIAGNFTLRAADARIEQARAVAEINAAPLLGRLDLAGTLDHSNGIKNSATQQLIGQASIELDLWGRNRALAASGIALAQASEFDADTARMALSASLVDTYFQILSLGERVRLARQIADDARHVLSLIEVQREAGTATELQVQQQRAALATFDTAVPALQQQSELATHALAALCASAPEGFAIAARDLDGLERPDIIAPLPASLLRRRPDIAAAEARLIAANIDIGAARAAFFPAISLNAALGLGSPRLSRLFPASTLTDLGGGLLGPIFQGGALRGQLRFDHARREELIATYQQTLIAAFQDVEDALSTVALVERQETIQATADRAARKAAGLAELQYRLGSADYLTVLTTEQALYQAHDTLLQLRLQRLQAIVGLFRALGGGFDGEAETPSTPKGS